MDKCYHVLCGNFRIYPKINFKNILNVSVDLFNVSLHVVVFINEVTTFTMQSAICHTPMVDNLTINWVYLGGVPPDQIV